jgi:hypothetical protein
MYIHIYIYCVCVYIYIQYTYKFPLLGWCLSQIWVINNQYWHTAHDRAAPTHCMQMIATRGDKLVVSQFQHVSTICIQATPCTCEQPCIPDFSTGLDPSPPLTTGRPTFASSWKGQPKKTSLKTPKDPIEKLHGCQTNTDRTMMFIIMSAHNFQVLQVSNVSICLLSVAEAVPLSSGQGRWESSKDSAS